LWLQSVCLLWIGFEWYMNPLSTVYSGFTKMWYLDLVWNLDDTLYNFNRYLTERERTMFLSFQTLQIFIFYLSLNLSLTFHHILYLCNTFNLFVHERKEGEERIQTSHIIQEMNSIRKQPNMLKLFPHI